MSGKIRVFSDFDGTISIPDIGATLFNYFAANQNSGTVKLWMENRVDSRECLLRECAYIDVSQERLINKLEEIELRPGFHDFVIMLQGRDVPLHLLSDGLDFYIEAFLERFDLNHLDIHSNRAHFINDRLYPSFPHFDQGCGFCGCCKGERIRTLARSGEFRVFIGDGYSDRCAVEAVDLIFARGDLASLCREKGVDYLTFSDFFEIADYFEEHLLQ